VYFVIVDWPNFPPRQAIDWLGYFVAIAFMVDNFIPRRWYAAAYVCLVVGSSASLFWPLISYKASFNSHWLIWLELSISALWMCLVLCRKPVIHRWDQHLVLMLASVVCGIVSIVSGSLLLGFLCISLACLQGFPCIRSYFVGYAYYKPAFLFLAFVQLLLVRHYADASLLAVIAIAIVFAIVFALGSLSILFRLSGLKHIVITLFLLAAALALVIHEEFFVQSVNTYSY
jgi:hypothetical protein